MPPPGHAGRERSVLIDCQLLVVLPSNNRLHPAFSSDSDKTLSSAFDIVEAIDENRASRRSLFMGTDVRGLIMGRIAIECEGII